MTHDPLPPTSKPGLDELLTTIGVSRDELTSMTADDLFAAATRWQDATAVTDAAPLPLESEADRVFDRLQGRPAGQFTLN